MGIQKSPYTLDSGMAETTASCLHRAHRFLQNTFKAVSHLMVRTSSSSVPDVTICPPDKNKTGISINAIMFTNAGFFGKDI